MTLKSSSTSNFLQQPLLILKIQALLRSNRVQKKVKHIVKPVHIFLRSESKITLNINNFYLILMRKRLKNLVVIFFLYLFIYFIFITYIVFSYNLTEKKIFNRI